MNIKQTSNKNQTVVFSITVKNDDIKKRYTKALNELVKTADVEGFRKGKAPKDLAEKALGKERIYDKLIQDLLPEAYKEILDNNDIKPVIAPKVQLKEAKEGEDWVLEMSIALEPKVSVPDYKKLAKDVKGSLKKDDIWVPGKGDPSKPEELDKEAFEKKEKYLNSLLEKLLEKTTIELSDIIIEQEINQRLARLVDDVRKIGLSIDEYFKSRNTDQEKVKDEFKKDILSTYKLEYALNEIGDKEGITVEKEEINKLVESMPDEESRKQALENAYAYGMMMRKQKILDFLGSL